jgi:hypothetical protein
MNGTATPGGPLAGARPPGSALLLVLCVVPSLHYGWLLWSGWPGSIFAPTNALVVRDFVNLWAGGRLLLAGDLETLFSPAAYDAWLKASFGPRLDLHTWSYPPPALALALPFALLPLVPGFLVWTAGTIAALGLVLRAGGMGAAALAAVLLSPASLENALAGQNGALFAAVLAGGLAFAERRPWLAGMLLGLLLLKPQLGLLVPVALVALGAWRAIAWTAAMAAALILGSALLAGPGVWVDYLTQVAPFMRRIAEVPFGLAFHYQMPTPFMSVRAAGGGLGLAQAVQAAASLAAAAVVWWAWRHGRLPAGAATGGQRPAGTATGGRLPDGATMGVRLPAGAMMGGQRPDATGLGGRLPAGARIGLVLLLAPVATPYAHSYDMVCAAVGIVLLIPSADQAAGPRAVLARLALLLAWVWPGVAFRFGLGVMPGMGAMVMAAAVLGAVMLIRASPARPKRP